MTDDRAERCQLSRREPASTAVVQLMEVLRVVLRLNSTLRIARTAIVFSAIGISLVIAPAGMALLAQSLDYRAPDKAPPSWLQFAKLVKYHFETWIAADEPVANRFRAYAADQAGKDGGSPRTLVVRAWLNPDGSVERVSFPPLPDPQADEDLHAILKGGNVGEAPPPEMLQPLSLRFSLNPGR